MSKDRTKPSLSELRSRVRFASVDEAEALARRRLPRALFDRLCAGADRGVTLRENVRAFEEVTFLARGAAAAPRRGLATSVLGTELSLPVLLAPVGGLRMVHSAGVLACAQAAGAAGTICVASSATGHTPGELAAAASGPVWQQVSVLGGRQRAEELIDEARRLAMDALVVGIDAAVRPKGSPLRLDLRTVLKFAPDLARHPQWTGNFVRDGFQVSVANSALGAGAQAEVPPLSWKDFSWIREHWQGPIVVKGVIIGSDARRAVDEGANAVIVSNHGGLMLDGTRATLRALPEVLDAVPREVEVLLDGGVRSGGDVVKAIALGARAVLIGRPYLMGLAAAGSAGVRQIIELFRLDIDRTLAFLGCPSVAELNTSFIEVRQEWGGYRGANSQRRRADDWTGLWQGRLHHRCRAWPGP